MRKGLASVPRGPPHALEDNLRAFWTLHSSLAHLPVPLASWPRQGVVPYGSYARLLMMNFAS